MLIQNTSSIAAPAPRLTSDSAPAPVVAPETKTAPVEPKQDIAKQQATPPTTAQLQSAVDNINKAMKQSNANIEFSIDKDTKQQIIKVVESQTGEVIRQFPSEEILAISRAIDHMQEMQQGLLVKQQA